MANVLRPRKRPAVLCPATEGICRGAPKPAPQKKRSYRDKLAQLREQTLLPRLPEEEQGEVEALAERYRFTLQQLRIVAQVARDLRMWREGTLAALWRELEGRADLPKDRRARARELVAAAACHVAALADGDKRYPSKALEGPPRRKVKLAEAENDRRIYGLCPAWSEQTICCGLYTLDAVTGCPYDCSYCTIQTFYGERAELDAGLRDKLAAIGAELEPETFRHIGTGQSSDALVWGNAGGMLDALCDFAAAHPQVLLELKTKSARVAPLLERGDVPANVICSWTLGPQPVIANEEHGTADLDARLDAARRVADAGLKVAFHCHPMVRYEGWREDYVALAERLLARFEPHEVLFFTLGSVTLIRPVVKAIRERGGESKILQMRLTPDHHGKLTYPEEQKVELFSTLYGALEPWHEGVFFYLCMEPKPIWERSLGFCHADSLSFEVAFAERFRRSVLQGATSDRQRRSSA